MKTIDKFKKYLGLPSPKFYEIEIINSEGIYLFSSEGKKYVDLCSGVGVNNVGHKNPAVLKAVEEQSKRYFHALVYGEIVISEQAEYAEKLINHLPENLEQVFFVNSGSEAIEGALKLAKKYTGKYQIVSFKNAYHGSTIGAFSIMPNEKLKMGFRPLMPSVRYLQFNNEADLDLINDDICCAVVEPIQAEAGVVLPKNNFLKKLKEKCQKHNCLLILDEVQTGFGRAGSLFAFEKYGFEPDILVLAKALGAGFPLGAFISSKKIMSVLQNPPLGHITTYGGNPIACRAGKAAFDFLIENQLFENANKRGKQIIEAIKHHQKIKNISGSGLLYAVELENEKIAEHFIQIALNETFLITDRFLYKPNAFRIAPPLIINENETQDLISRILTTLDKI